MAGIFRPNTVLAYRPFRESGSPSMWLRYILECGRPRSWQAPSPASTPHQGRVTSVLKRLEF